MSINSATSRALANRLELARPVKLTASTGEFKDKCVVALSEVERDAIVAALRATALPSTQRGSE